MLKLRGVFDYLPGIETIPTENISAWIKKPDNPKILENQVGNRVLYPQSLPVSAKEMEVDLAIIREALKIHSLEYYSKSLKKIYIPEFFLERFPPLQNLVWTFIDAFRPVGITTIYLKSESAGVKSLGTLIRPENLAEEGWVDIELNGQKYKVNAGSLTVLPLEGSRINLKFESNAAKIDGKNKAAYIICGGESGVIVDTRK